MSVVVRLPHALVDSCGGGSDVRLYSKGADSVMWSLLAPGSRGSDDASYERLDKLLYDWADIALRTLVFAKREVADFDGWNARYMAATQDPEEVRKNKAGERGLIAELQVCCDSPSRTVDLDLDLAPELDPGPSP